MKKLMMLLALFVMAGIGLGDQLLINGDFEQPIDVGWTDTVVGSTGSSLFTWCDTLGQPTPGYAACVYKTLASYAALGQTVAIPNANVVFEWDGRLRIGGGSSTCWPTAAFLINYQKLDGTSLGNTRFYLHDQYNTWVVSDTMNLIEVNTPEVWAHYTLNVADEIADRLPGINAADVAKVRIELFSYDNGT